MDGLGHPPGQTVVALGFVFARSAPILRHGVGTLAPAFSYSGPVEGYTSASYGDRFADIYDDWYTDITPADDTAAFVDGHTTGPLLELGSGTGRLLAPLATRGRSVIGLDTSLRMLARSADVVDAPVVVGDMAAPPFADETFGGVFVAFNTLFNVPTVEGQAAVFSSAARMLRAGGCLIVEAFVPTNARGRDERVEVMRMDVDRVVLRVSRTDFDARTVSGQYIDLIHGQAVTLRPWHLRFAPPDELDAMAASAGLSLTERVGGWDGRDFAVTGDVHVSVYRRQ